MIYMRLINMFNKVHFYKSERPQFSKDGIPYTWFEVDELVLIPLTIEDKKEIDEFDKSVLPNVKTLERSINTFFDHLSMVKKDKKHLQDMKQEMETFKDGLASLLENEKKGNTIMKNATRVFSEWYEKHRETQKVLSEAIEKFYQQKLEMMKRYHLERMAWNEKEKEDGVRVFCSKKGEKEDKQVYREAMNKYERRRTSFEKDYLEEKEWIKEEMQKFMAKVRIQEQDTLSRSLSSRSADSAKRLKMVKEEKIGAFRARIFPIVHAALDAFLKNQTPCFQTRLVHKIDKMRTEKLAEHLRKQEQAKLAAEKEAEEKKRKEEEDRLERSRQDQAKLAVAQEEIRLQNEREAMKIQGLLVDVAARQKKEQEAKDLLLQQQKNLQDAARISNSERAKKAENELIADEKKNELKKKQEEELKKKQKEELKKQEVEPKIHLQNQNEADLAEADEEFEATRISKSEEIAKIAENELVREEVKEKKKKNKKNSTVVPLNHLSPSQSSAAHDTHFARVEGTIPALNAGTLKEMIANAEANVLNFKSPEKIKKAQVDMEIWKKQLEILENPKDAERLNKELTSLKQKMDDLMDDL